MAIINTGSFAKLLYPGLSKIYGTSYNEFATQYTDLFDTFTDKRAYLEDMAVTGLGQAQLKTEGSPVKFDDMSQSFYTRYTHAVWALGYIITREMFEDDQYGYVGAKKSKALAFSMRQTKEVNMANIYNRAFNASYTGGDGVSLANAAHPNFTGSTWSNISSTAATLSETSLEQAVIDISKWTDDRGLQIQVLGKCLVIPTDLQFEAERILYTTNRVGTTDNDLNAIKVLSKIPDGYKVNQYLDNATRWFLRTNVQEGMKYISRRKIEFTIDNEFDTENAKFKATERYSGGWSDARGLWASNAA